MRKDVFGKVLFNEQVLARDVEGLRDCWMVVV